MLVKNDFDNLVEFRGWTCVAKVLHYNNGSKAIQLYDANDGDPVATASINIPEWTQRENEIFIKEYSENSGITESLVKAKIIEPDYRTIPYGPYRAPIVVATLLNPEKWK